MIPAHCSWPNPKVHLDPTTMLCAWEFPDPAHIPATPLYSSIPLKIPGPENKVLDAQSKHASDFLPF